MPIPMKGLKGLKCLNRLHHLGMC